MEMVGFGEIMGYIESLILEKIYRFEVRALWAVQTFKFKDPQFDPVDLLYVEGIGITEIEILGKEREKYICLVKTEKENKFHELFTDFNLILPPDRPLVLTPHLMKISFISYEDQLKSVLNQLKTILPEENLRVAQIQDIKHEFNSYHSLLTSRQLEIIHYAVEHGYFEIPRRISAKELAEFFHISVSALNEHLRKVERKIFGALFPS